MKNAFLLLTGVIIAFSSFAGDIIYSNRVEGAAITGSVMNVHDGEYLTMATNSSWSSLFTNRKVTNRVTLGLNPEIAQTTSFSGTVTVSVKLWKYSGSSFLPPTTVSKVLTISNNTAGTEIDELSTFVESGAHRMEVTVTGSTGITLANVYLEASIEVERIYAFNSAVAITGTDIAEGTDYIDFNWDVVKGAEFYELEWVHINDYHLNGGTIGSFQISYDFYGNSTRLIIRENHYRIPRIFDRGYLLLRVRGIGLQGTNFDVRKEGVWNLPENGKISDLTSQQIYISGEKDANMNWVHQVGYTENGKRFEGMSFMDGMGRVRQSVAFNPVTGQTIVSNVYYDAHGRPVISDLPTPGEADVMKHHSVFNKAEGTTDPFGPGYFDVENPLCSPSLSLGMDNGSGTSEYYSTGNDNYTEGVNTLIPDAEHYPYSRVHFMPDQTGRVASAGMFGPDFQPGENHDMQFLYGTPEQEELNRLFGSEAGYASHYQKRVVTDQNGQVYIEYYDLAGRLVANGMAGSAPSNLVETDGGHDPESEVTTLIDGSVNEHVFAAEISTSIVRTIISDATYTFDYDLEPVQYTSECINAEVCFDCIYNLTLEIDEVKCGTQMYSNTVVINGGDYSSVCNGTYPFELLADVYLPEGSYSITRTLSLAQEAVNEYWCTALEENICEAPAATLFNSLYAEADLSNCEEDEKPETDDGLCEMNYQLMLSDVSPGGQYALYNETAGVITVTSPISVLNNSNLLGPDFDWEHPDSPGYLDENGAPAKVLVTPLGGGLYSPSIKTGSVVTGPNPDGSYTVAPESLSNVADFIRRFEESWAEALVIHHPEYCMYEFCVANSASQAFDAAMQDVTTHAAACSSGLYNPLAGTITSPQGVTMFIGCISSPDPFFAAGGPGASLGTAMISRMDNYITVGSTSLSIWEYAILVNECPDANTPALISACLGHFNGSSCNNDQVWLTFRAMYLALKQEFVLEAARAGSNCSPYLGCIGDNTATGTPCGQLGDSEPIWNMEQLVHNNLDISDPQGTLDDLSEDLCNTMCSNYADDWMAQFVNCPGLSPSQITPLRNDLIAICTFGCSGEHPQGAISLPLTSGTVTLPSGGTVPAGASFNDVLALHISGFDESTLCSELLVSAPGRYQEEMTGINYLDQCGCDLLLNTQDEFIVLESAGQLPAGVTTVEELLMYNTGIDIDDSDGYICDCENAFGAGWKPGSEWNTTQTEALETLAVVVPEELTCEDECTTCEMVTTYMNSLQTRLGDGLEESENYELILTNYLNQELGFTLTAADYLEFMHHCSGTPENPVCELTDEMNSWVAVTNLLVHRGQLLNNGSNKVDLLTGNIVYPNSALQAVTEGTHYWSEQADSQLDMYFGTETETPPCGMRLFLPEDETFGFEDIIAFTTSGSSDSECGDNPRFFVNVRYLDCGEIKTARLTGEIDCFVVQRCYCDASVTLCNAPESDGIMGSEIPCYEPALSQMYQQFEEDWAARVQVLKEEFRQDYLHKCALTYTSELLTIEGPEELYQFTLYYYDQAGNLVKTVAPEGVETVSNHADINLSRKATSGIDDQEAPQLPGHSFKTEYVYNSYDQPVSTTNPDQVGATVYRYDYYGRLVASQNPVQAPVNKYSYVLFDPIGRPVESGQVVPAAALTDAILKKNDLGVDFNAWVMAGTRTEVTRTTYDQPLTFSIGAMFPAGQQENLRLRVAAVAYYEAMAGISDLTLQYTSSVHYSYDLHGNVTKTVQYVPMMADAQIPVKGTGYEYELLSGNVTKVKYAEGERDQMTHIYTYDKLNRLTEVHTSTDGEIHKSREAHYRYYDHGPVSRVEIGEHKVQGNDFAYTINGWLKGMNSNTLQHDRDMGRDGGAVNTGHELFARDVTGFTLGYYRGDYASIGSAGFEASLGSGNDINAALRDLWNGNIAHSVTAIDNLPVQAGVYSYDQLQRLKEMKVFRGDASLLTNNIWPASAYTDDYYSSYTYDRNGNLKTLVRNGAAVPNLSMDNFTYNYTAGTNRLTHVTDPVSPGNYTEDIDNQSAGNYVYNDLGMLTGDAAEQMQLVWRFGDKKLKTVIPTDLISPQVDFVYTPFGQRILKIEKPRVSGSVVSAPNWKYTYYTYDANGQVMATYDVTMNGTGNGTATLDELNIYGASRLGTTTFRRKIYDGGTALPTTGYGLNGIWNNRLGEKHYELTNHLGNVNAVITDRKIPFSNGDYYVNITGTGYVSVPYFIPNIYIAGTTVETWVRSTNSTGTYPLIYHTSTSQGITLNVVNGKASMDGKQSLIAKSSGPSTTTITDGAWHHVAGVVEPVTGGWEWKIYVDGVLENSQVLPAGSFGFGGTLHFGRNSASNTYYQGDMKEVSYWSVPRTGAQIISDMNTTFTGLEPDLLGYWPLKDNLNPTEDVSPNARNATLNNSAAFVSEKRYNAVVVMRSDYYPFGMQMSGRHTNDDTYRYGYNGMEKDKELKGEGNSYTTEFRQYDPRVGRWLSLDPLMHEFPWMSPYVAFDNNPVIFIDPYGLKATADYYDIKTGKHLGSDGISDGKVFLIDKSQWIKLNQEQGHKMGSLDFQGIAVGGYGAQEVQDVGQKHSIANNAANATANEERQTREKYASVAPQRSPIKAPPTVSTNYSGPSMQYISNADAKDGQDFLYKQQRLAEYSNNVNIGPYIGIGQGLTYGPEAVANVFIPELAIARIATMIKVYRAANVYRAVSAAELADISQFGLRSTSGAYETGKLFAPTIEEAASFGKNNFGWDGIPNTIVRVKVPKSIMKSAYHFSADGMNAISISSELLPGLRVTPLNYSPFIPKL